jgi:hypothetical protein
MARSTARVTCPACGKQVALTARRRLWQHGRPVRPQSGRRLTRIWPAKHFGRRVVTVPGPGIWNPTTLEGAA